MNGLQRLQSRPAHPLGSTPTATARPNSASAKRASDGLDVLAITEHVEYRSHEGKMLNFLKGYVPKGTEAINNNIIRRSADERGIQSDLNLPVKLARETARKYGLTIIPGAEITREPIAYGHYNAPFHHGQQLPLRHRRPAIAPQRQRRRGRW